MTKIYTSAANDIFLQDMSRRDKEAIFAILSDPKVRRPFGLFSERSFSQDAVTGWCRIAETVNKETNDIDKFYVIKKGRRIIGYFGAGPDTDYPDKLDQWEVGYFLDARYRGHGIIPDILSAFMKQARGSAVKELFASVKPDNHASQRVLEKAGFVRNGFEERWRPITFFKDGSGRMGRPPKDKMLRFELKLT